MPPFDIKIHLKHKARSL